MRSGTELVREIKLTDWSMAGNLSNRSSGVQIPRDICTRLKRYLYSAKCIWIIKWLIRLIDPIPEETFLVIALIWLLHVKFSSINTPRDLPPCCTFLQSVALCLSTALYAYICTHASWHFMAYDVTTVNGFTISLEVSLFFSPSANFCLLVCSEVKCKSNIFWVLDFKSFETHCWIKKISLSHFSPASRPLRSPTSRPSLSRLPYPSRPLFSRAPAPLSPPPLRCLNNLVISARLGIWNSQVPLSSTGP